ncbi:MAG: tetratricopeptide repeat protein [Bacteroidota bacterium]|nr:tetratricopeptide repeat protein [Bacteroidota bacterium]
MKTAFTIMVLSILVLSCSQNQKSKNNLSSDDVVLDSILTKAENLISSGEFNKSHALIDSALAAVSKKKHAAIVKLHIKKGYTYRSSNDELKAIETFRKALLYKESLDKGNLLYNLYNDIGISYYKISDFDKATINFKHSYKIAQAKLTEEDEAIALANIATMENIRGNDKLAVEYFLKALKIFEKKENKVGISKIYNNLGVIFRRLDEPDKALEYYYKALELKQALKDSGSIGETYINIGVLYKQKKQYLQAVNYLDKALNIFTKNGDLYGKAKTLNNLGTVYQKNKAYGKAMSAFWESLEIRESISDMKGVASSYHNIANVLRLEKDYPKSIEYFEKSYRLTDSLDLPEELMEVNYDLYNLYKEQQSFSKALEYYIKYSVMKDSVISMNKFDKINSLEAKYQAQKKEQELEILKKENQIQKNRINKTYYVSGVISLLLIAGALISILLFRQQKLVTTNKNIILEKKVLRTQMNPHFIFNSLLAIQSFMFENEKMAASKYLSDFAKLIRLILSNSRKEYIVFNKEIETLQYYFKLQKLRFDNKFDYTIEVSDLIETHSLYIPPMLAQPIVENSIEHGVRALKNKGMIKITFDKKGDNLLFQVEDNGLGFSQKKNDTYLKEKSFSLNIIKERLKIFFPKTKTRIHTANLRDAENTIIGSKVSFLIPYKKAQDVQNNNR